MENEENKGVFFDIREKITDAKERSIYNKYADSTPFDVLGFARELAIVVKESMTLPTRVSGFIKKTGDETVICINKNDGDARKRFTISHELGHYFLHRNLLESGLVDGVGLLRDGTHNEIEYEANEFGANLLMPEAVFRELWNNAEYDIDILATYFMVSRSAIVTRASMLNCANENDSYFG